MFEVLEENYLPCELSDIPSRPSLNSSSPISVSQDVLRKMFALLPLNQRHFSQVSLSFLVLVYAIFYVNFTSFLFLLRVVLCPTWILWL